MTSIYKAHFIVYGSSIWFKEESWYEHRSFLDFVNQERAIELIEAHEATYEIRTKRQ